MYSAAVTASFWAIFSFKRAHFALGGMRFVTHDVHVFGGGSLSESALLGSCLLPRAQMFSLVDGEIWTVVDVGE